MKLTEQRDEWEENTIRYRKTILEQAEPGFFDKKIGNKI